MAGQPAPDTKRVALRDCDTDAISFVLPIDAREMVQSGAYAYADVPVPTPLAPLQRTAHSERMVEVEEVSTGVRLFAHSIDARELVASGEYVIITVPPPEAPEPETTAAPETIPIEQLAAYLAGVTDGDVLLAMETADQRDDAKALYLARFEEIVNAPRL
jgi:hypothetical protein